jgi:hypothetical protein
MTACETQYSTTSDSAVCVPVSGELCAPPISVWVEGDDLLQEVLGTGACTFSTPANAGGATRIGGAILQSGTCHIVATAISGAIDEQDVNIGNLVQSAYCGCANYPKEGALNMLAFSKRKPTFGPDGQCQCPSDRYCYGGNSECSPNAATAQCLLRPTTCDDQVRSVCGCDGKVYANECLAYQAGTSMALASACSLPDTLFACGDVLCTRETQLCRVLFAPERNYESYRCEDGLGCRKAFSETCGCQTGDLCTCETIAPGAVMCRNQV